MLPALIFDLPALLAQAVSDSSGSIFHPPMDRANVMQLILRWIHILAGIVWIGHLYFFNFVNVNLMKVLDGPTKGKVIPQLMPRALWWFRWGAAVTVFAGLMYYAMYILSPDVKNANRETNAGINVWLVLLVWLLIPIITFAVWYFLLRSINDGRVLAVVMGLLVTVMSLVIVYWIESSMSVTVGARTESFASNRAHSIGIGGALGMIMFLNVWGIIWINQKRIIAWTYDNAEKGTAIPAESAKLARVAFLASRANTWLSLPMLFFMITSGHYPLFGK